ncbi:MAG: DUF998 domain-containing protein [Halodesulfurarchaeum sp.]
MSVWRRTAARCGLASPVVALLGIATAILRSDGFDPMTQALSDLGVAAGSAGLFNGGLVLAGLLGFPFAGLLFYESTNHWRRVGAALLGGAVLSLAGVGVFPSDTSLHVPAAVGFYGLFTYAMFLYGTGLVVAGASRRGLELIWLGISHVTAWLLWGVAGPPGLAIPEAIGAVLLAAWTVSGARRRRRPQHH